MISAQKEEVIWILDFAREQQTDHGQWVLSSVNIVAHEHITLLIGCTGRVENSYQVLNHKKWSPLKWMLLFISDHYGFLIISNQIVKS